MTLAPASAPVGRVAFVGAGPGQADLITLRGAQRLAQAAVVLTDALADPALRDLAPQARWLHVGKRGFADSTGQAAINALLIKSAHEVGAGGLVVRLKGGDPSVFGRLEEELQAMAEADIACEVVPGVTAALAAAASAQRPLTRRGSGRSVSFATAMTRAAPEASTDPSDSLASGPLRASHSADTEVFYMAGKQLGTLARQLVQAGWPAQTEVCVMSRAGWPDEMHSDHTIDTLGQAGMLHAGRPTVVVVGAGARPLDAAQPAATDHSPAPSKATLNT
ncbi:MAG: uroporphyrinogen-III C-methyltransferase [Burkholderiaceae bacterium]|nr:uroporphyrinogen-III C-methyltransferase [Burkholderiaceae bacterium]